MSKSSTHLIQFSFKSEKIPNLMDLRLCMPARLTEPSTTQNDPFNEFFDALKSKISLDICIASPYASPEPYQRLAGLLRQPSDGKKHRLRLITATTDQSHFPKIKKVLKGVSDVLESVIRVIPAPSTHAQLPDDLLHCKLYIIRSRFGPQDSPPIEALFGSANFTWRGTGCKPSSTRPDADHHIELLARLENPEARLGLLNHYEQLYKIAGAWKPKTKRLLTLRINQPPSS
jgi:hypothetical protein